ncbi:MAG TPA: hypothetical protein VGD79_06015, partial [Thermoanaerobaculia bacterium]
FACVRVPTVWEVVRGKFRRKKDAKPFPSMFGILMRAVMLASSRREREILASADLVFHPPIDRFALMDFEALRDIVQVGYDSACKQLDGWRADGQLAKVTNV